MKEERKTHEKKKFKKKLSVNARTRSNIYDEKRYTKINRWIDLEILCVVLLSMAVTHYQIQNTMFCVNLNSDTINEKKNKPTNSKIHKSIKYIRIGRMGVYV